MAQLIVQSIEPINDGKYHIIGVVTDGSRKMLVDVQTSSLITLKSAGLQALSDLSASVELRGLKAGDIIDIDPKE